MEIRIGYIYTTLVFTSKESPHLVYTIRWKPYLRIHHEPMERSYAKLADRTELTQATVPTEQQKLEEQQFQV